MSETYVSRLRVLQDIRRMTGGKFQLSLPQICVVGDQSSGKSSVLTQITDIPFPTKSGICTKAAIVVECVRTASDRFEIRDGDTYVEVQRENLASRILALQERALEKTGEKVSREEIHVRASGPEQVDLVVIDLPGIIHQGEGKAEVAAMIEEYVKSPQTLIMLVSEAKQDMELVTAIGTAQKHDPAGSRTIRVLTKFDNFDSEDAKNRACKWVDVLDLQTNGLGSASCSSSNSKGISNEKLFSRDKGKVEGGSKSTVLFGDEAPKINFGARSGVEFKMPEVFKVDAFPAFSAPPKAFKVDAFPAFGAPPKADTKKNDAFPEIFGARPKADTKTNSGNTGGLPFGEYLKGLGTAPKTEAVKNSDSTGKFTFVPQMKGKSRAAILSLSPHAVICAPGGKEYNASEEEQELRDNLGLPPQRSGISTLKERLPPIYSALIGNNVEKVIEQVDAKLKLAQDSLMKIGREPKSSDSMILECHRVLVEMNPALEEALSKPLWQFEEAVRGTKKNITKEWTSKKYVPNAFRTPCFQGNQAFELCAVEICELFWRPILEALLCEIDDVLSRQIPSTLAAFTSGVAPNLLKALRQEWVGNFYQSQLLQPFKEKCRAVLAKERYFGTLNHYLTDKVDTDRICSDEFIEECIKLTSVETYSKSRPMMRGSIPIDRDALPHSTVQQNLREVFETARTTYAKLQKTEDLHTRQCREVYNAVCAHWQVEHKTLTDNIIKEVRKCILDPFLVWVRSTITPQNRGLMAAAVEDPDVVTEREHLLEQIEAMRSCEEKLQTIL